MNPYFITNTMICPKNMLRQKNEFYRKICNCRKIHFVEFRDDEIKIVDIVEFENKLYHMVKIKQIQ